MFGRVAKEVMGAFAEYVAITEDLVAKMPSSLDFDLAATVPLSGLTALQCLRDELQVKPGQRIFISGGAGGVGTFAIQIAKWLGAEVATTASPFFRGDTPVRSLGADRVIHYTPERFENLPHDLDGALDLIGGDTLAKLFAIEKRGGKVVSIVGIPKPETALKDLGRGVGLAALFWLASVPTQLWAAAHGVRYRYIFMHPSGAEVGELAGLIDAGKLRVTLDRAFPFAGTGEALACLERGHAKGKVVVRIVKE